MTTELFLDLSELEILSSEGHSCHITQTLTRPPAHWDSGKQHRSNRQRVIVESLTLHRFSFRAMIYSIAGIMKEYVFLIEVKEYKWVSNVWEGIKKRRKLLLSVLSGGYWFHLSTCDWKEQTPSSCFGNIHSIELNCWSFILILLIVEIFVVPRILASYHCWDCEV